MALLVDVLGILGIVLTVIVYQQKDRDRMLLWKIANDVTWAIHYLLLGATSAVASTSVAVIRSCVFLNYRHKWAQSKAWLAVFMVANVGFGLLAWEGPLTLLTMCGSLACIAAYWIGSPKLARIVAIPAGAMYLAYAIISGSVEGSICESFMILSAIVGLFRYDIQKKGVDGQKQGTAGASS